MPMFMRVLTCWSSLQALSRAQTLLSKARPPTVSTLRVAHRVAEGAIAIVEVKRDGISAHRTETHGGCAASLKNVEPVLHVALTLSIVTDVKCVASSHAQQHEAVVQTDDPSAISCASVPAKVPSRFQVPTSNEDTHPRAGAATLRQASRIPARRLTAAMLASLCKIRR
jgi:hypothetical protein